MKDEEVKTLLDKVSELMNENSTLERKNMRLESERDQALQKWRKNNWDIGEYIGGSFVFSVITFFVGIGVCMFINGCADTNNHYVNEPVIQSIEPVHNRDGNIVNGKCYYEISNHVFIKEESGKFGIGDTLKYNK